MDLLGADFPRYSDADRAELEAALRTDNPAKLEAIYASWADTGPRGVIEPTPEPTCPACRRARERFGADSCDKHAR